MIWCFDFRGLFSHVVYANTILVNNKYNKTYLKWLRGWLLYSSVNQRASERERVSVRALLFISRLFIHLFVGSTRSSIRPSVRLFIRLHRFDNLWTCFAITKLLSLSLTQPHLAFHIKFIRNQMIGAFSSLLISFFCFISLPFFDLFPFFSLPLLRNRVTHFTFIARDWTTTFFLYYTWSHRVI